MSKHPEFMLPAPSACGRIHIAGAGGVGMSALAEYLHLRGYNVSGSDRFLDQAVQHPVLDKLRKQAVELAPQDGSAVDRGDLSAFIYSTAIEGSNPEWIAAEERGIPMLHRVNRLFSRVFINDYRKPSSKSKHWHRLWASYRGCRMCYPELQPMNQRCDRPMSVPTGSFTLQPMPKR